MTVRLSRVATIFRKELTDTLRDRRTLIFMLLIPIAAIPLLIIGLTSLMVSQITKLEEETSNVVIIGHDNLPNDLQSTFAERPGISIRMADGSRRGELIDTLKAGEFQALIAVPDGLAGAIEQEQPSAIEVFYDEAEMKSEFAVERIQEALTQYKDDVVAGRLQERAIPNEVLTPFEVRTTNVAPPEKMAGKEFGAILPYLIIIMCFMGAMYPAIDLAAGEKERGTLETLLICPAAREELVLGKYLVVLVTGVVAAFLSLGSLIYSMGDLVEQPIREAAKMMAIKFDLATAILVLLTILPLAGMFAGILLSVSVFARSFKEAQSYVTALNMAVILPAFVSMLPGVEIDYMMALIPVINASLILRDAMAGPIEWGYAVLALLANSVFALVALVFSTKWFSRESVIFRI